MTDFSAQYRIEFAKTASLLLQQRGSKLRNHVMVGSHKGEGASPVDQYGVTEARERTGRAVPKESANTPVDRRWAYPRFFDWSDIVDNIDLLQTASDPQNPLVQACTASLGRRIDDEIIRAFFADARTGKQGGTTTSFPAGQQVAHGGVGLTFEKLRAAKKILMANEVDLANDPIICVVNSVQHDALLGEIEITSSDFNGGDRPVLKEGIITRFLGIEFVHCERLTLSGANRRVPIYAKSGMHLGIWSDVATDIGPRRDLEGNPMEVTGSVTIGATRTEEKKVVEVLCTES
jgi:hypothetical protein